MSKKTNITMIIGDGISEEVANSAMKIISTLGINIEFEIFRAGAKYYKETGKLIEDGLFESIERNKVAIKGPIATPIGTGFRSINVELRKKYDLYANIRPIKSIGSFGRYDDVDVVIFRENTEDLYAGLEEKISDDEMRSIKIITRAASMRIAKAAFRYAKGHGRKKVTCVTKANIMKYTDGLFLEVAREVSKDYSEIELEEILIDNMCMQLVIDPSRYEVILTENLYGDILSDLCAGLVGGLGLAASANIGDKIAIFEPVHGSAPDIMGKNLANPTAMILSASMLLDYLGYNEAKMIKKSVVELLEQGISTKDLGGNLSTKEFIEEVINNIIRE